ncbi:DUF393 domain-containing protein [Candidatus Peregrinibacteria bacterium]|nr:DUF393 domain-containing protein [Candidatus Peregrinibacteria bacterium]
MKKIIDALYRFLFAPIPITGFGLMRIAWAFVVLLFLLFQWSDIALYYSADGIFPQEFSSFHTRSVFRFTLLKWITDPQAIFALYLLHLLTLSCMLVGLHTRLMTIVSVLLLYTFHEGNPLPLGGGDTLLRLIGFLLMLAPRLDAFSLDRLEHQWSQFRRTKTLLPVPTMSIWPWRLLLWQMIILYGTSLWYKSTGTMWADGTAAIAALHHPQFSRIPVSWMDELAPLSPLISAYVLIEHIGWVFLLVPEWITRWFLEPFPRIPLRRCLIGLGLLLHGLIFILMDAGSFSLAIFVAYTGLLLGEDFQWLRQVTRKVSPHKVTVLYDGKCGLCLKSIFFLELLDHLNILRCVNFWNATHKNKYAPDLKIEDLNRAMHVRVFNGKTYKGFDGFRALSWVLPPLWLLTPLLYIPGIPLMGRRMYARIASRRRRCSHKGCNL